MKKKLICSLLIIVMLLPLCIIQAAAATVISLNAPAIPATVGDTVNLSDYTLDGISCTNYSWTAITQGAAISGGKFSATQKGVFAFSGVSGSKTAKLYIVVKAAGETEHVLYYNDFSSSNISDFKTTGDVSVKDGKLVLKMASTRPQAFFPEFLNDFGNYKIEAVATITEQLNEGRWFSVMHRIQNNNFPYYQMAIRKDMTLANGVEFAEMTPDSQWAVTHTASFTEKMDAAKNYNFTVYAYNNNVVEYINDKQLIYADNATKYQKGRVGVQADNCTMVLDSIKITLVSGLPEFKGKPAFADVRQPSTTLTTTPAIVSYINSSNDLSKVLTNSPATAVVRINNDGKITSSTGSVIATLDELYTKLGNKVIPAFMPASNTAVDKLVAYLSSKEYEDAFVISENDAIIKYARSKYKMLRGVVVSSSKAKTEKDLLALRDRVNASGSKVVIVPYELADKATMFFLQKLGTTVWVAPPATETVDTAFTQILSGANGVVTANRAQVESCFTKLPTKTMTRQILIVGHRGMPGTSPENSIESSRDAYKRGADTVENDVYLTKDGRVVVMHDGTLERTTTATGADAKKAIESMTLAEIQKYYQKEKGGYKNAKIPTLDDYLEAFKGTGKCIFIEIKSSNPQIVTKIKALLDQYKMHDQVVVISFNGAQLNEMYKVIPGVSRGFLTSVAGSNISETIRKALESTQSYNSTFNPSYTGITQSLVNQAVYRGMTLWPWTYRNQSDFKQHFIYGVHGLTNDDSYWVENSFKNLQSEKQQYSLAVGKSVDIKFTATQYNETKVVNPSNLKIHVISGEKNVTVSGNKVTLKANGTVKLVATAETAILGEKYNVVTEIITISPTSSSDTSKVESKPESKPEISTPVTSEVSETESEAVTSEVSEDVSKEESNEASEATTESKPAESKTTSVATSKPESNESKAPEKSNIGGIIAGVIIGLALIGGGVWFFWFKKKKVA